MNNKNNSGDLGELIRMLTDKSKSGDAGNEADVRNFIDANLSKEQAAKLNEVLSDEKKTKAVLESDIAKTLFEKLGGGKF